MKTIFPSYYPTVEHVIEVTDFTDEKTAEAALETLLWLENGAPEKFDGLKGTYRFAMDQFITIEEGTYPYTDEIIKKPKNCGTACCIAGAISAFKVKGKHKKFGNLEINELIAGSDNLDNLFMGQWRDKNDEVWCYDLDLITSEEATTCFMHYLKTGKVNWRKAIGKSKFDRNGGR